MYCSALNPGAAELITEVADVQGWELSGVIQRRSTWVTHHKTRPETTLFVTENIQQLVECDHMLLYLTRETWTRGGATDALAAHVRHAMDLGVHILLAHEMPGVGQEARRPCEFGSFFSCADGATPGDLLKRGIYSEIAVALKGGEWRKASMALLTVALDRPGERTVGVTELGTEASHQHTHEAGRGEKIRSSVSDGKARRSHPDSVDERPGLLRTRRRSHLEDDEGKSGGPAREAPPSARAMCAFGTAYSAAPTTSNASSSTVASTRTMAATREDVGVYDRRSVVGREEIELATVVDNLAAVDEMNATEPAEAELTWLEEMSHRLSTRLSMLSFRADPDEVTAGPSSILSSAHPSIAEVAELEQADGSMDDSPVSHASLPAGWSEAKDAQGRVYYYNTRTRAKPTVADLAAVGDSGERQQHILSTRTHRRRVETAFFGGVAACARFSRRLHVTMRLLYSVWTTRRAVRRRVQPGLGIPPTPYMTS